MVQRKLELGGKFVRGAIKRLKRQKKWPPKDRLGDFLASGFISDEAERLTGETVGKKTRNLGKTLKKGTGKIAKVRAIRDTLKSKMKKVLAPEKKLPLRLMENKNLERLDKTMSNLDKYEDKIHKGNIALIDKVRKKPTLHKEGGLIKKPKSVRIAKRGWGKVIK
tara:strand:- start:185 stop:679 length:495 start_codon:yes stop_codon:yes gene_type:complete